MKSLLLNTFSLLVFSFIHLDNRVLGDGENIFLPERHVCDDDERCLFPFTCGVMDRVLHETKHLMKEIVEWATRIGYINNKTSFEDVNMKYLVQPVGGNGFTFEGNRTDVLPIVSQHGLFQSCSVFPMPNWVQLAAGTIGGYATCINIGDNANEEILNTIFLNMEKSVDEFARKIRTNPKFANGFNAIGFSQGNAIIRSYIIKYNDPPVKNFISVDGVCAGVSALPFCNPYNANTTLESNSYGISSLSDSRSLRTDQAIYSTKSHICMIFEEMSSELSYTTFMQENLFPSNYFVDRHPSLRHKYLKYSVQARISNEGYHFNETYRENFLSVDKFVWVMGLDDTVVIPREGEHWAQVDSHDFNRIIPMKKTDWFQSDSFGLQTAYKEGKFTFRTHPGSHTILPPKQYQSLIEEFFEH